MSRAGRFNAIALERVVFGRPAAEVVPGELERLGRSRACLLVSHSLRTGTSAGAAAHLADHALRREFGFSAGCTDTVRRVKQAYRHPLFVPQVVVLDPALTLHTPEWLWLSTGIRAVDHAVETLCSPSATAHSDGPALHALRLLGAGLPRSRADPADLDARLDCQLGVWASMAHNQDGIPMGASHGIGHVLGGTCGVPHGYTSCVMLPAVLDWNAGANPQAQARVSEALGRPGEPASQVVDELVRQLGLPRSLAEVCVSREQFDVVARNAMHDRCIHTNPGAIHGPEDVLQILGRFRVVCGRLVIREPVPSVEPHPYLLFDSSTKPPRCGQSTAVPVRPESRSTSSRTPPYRLPQRDHRLELDLGVMAC